MYEENFEINFLASEFQLELLLRTYYNGIPTYFDKAYYSNCTHSKVPQFHLVSKVLLLNREIN